MTAAPPRWSAVLWIFQLKERKLRVSAPPSVCQLAFGGVSSGQLTPTEIMLIAVIPSFLLEHNQQIIYFYSFIIKSL